MHKSVVPQCTGTKEPFSEKAGKASPIAVLSHLAAQQSIAQDTMAFRHRSAGGQHLPCGHTTSNIRAPQCRSSWDRLGGGDTASRCPLHECNVSESLLPESIEIHGSCDLA